MEAVTSKAKGPPSAARYGHFPEGWIKTGQGIIGPRTLPKSILSLGDSLSESQAFLWLARYALSGISDGEGYVHLSKELGTLSGQTSDWGRQTAPGACQRAHAEVATLLFGTNDLIQRNFSSGRLKRNLEAIIKGCKQAGTLPLLMTLPPLQGDTDVTAAANQVMRGLADAHSLPLFDFAQVLLDRGRLAADMPDGVHPTADAYQAINAAWTAFYKVVEWEVLRPARARRISPGEQADRLPWRLALDWRASEGITPDWRPIAGVWTLEKAQGAPALVGSAEKEAAAMLLPVLAPGPVMVEIEAAGTGELSFFVHNAGDAGLTGLFFGHGTNNGARTAINLNDQRVQVMEGVRPKPGVWVILRGRQGLHIAQWGADGRWRLQHPRSMGSPRPDRAHIGLYTWAAEIRVRRIRVWTVQTP